MWKPLSRPCAVELDQRIVHDLGLPERLLDGRFVPREALEVFFQHDRFAPLEAAADLDGQQALERRVAQRLVEAIDEMPELRRGVAEAGGFEFWQTASMRSASAGARVSPGASPDGAAICRGDRDIGASIRCEVRGEQMCYRDFSRRRMARPLGEGRGST